ncbi:MAG: excinuclease ABC subunit UvrC [Lachnospiraceae bacterium]|jgi:excinuclease ABC subunit C|nr:excinuclease ABC subunit UvrC [Lachnospiraceae bacterium]
MTFNIEEELKKLPSSPGVYLMHDCHDEIIYVGKAISLKNRVRQYFQSSRGKTAKILQMVQNIAWFEYILTDSEMEALVLECNLIKEHRPRYNTMLMDDKSYPYIKVTVQEEYPRILLSRDMKKDKSRYYGPYTSATAVKDTIELMHKLFRLRTCRRNLPEDIGKGRPCLNYHIGQCAAPCQGYITKEQYKEAVQGVMDFLGGDFEPVIRSLESQMKSCAENLDFETAVTYRELLNSVRHITQKQKITDSAGQEDRDIIALAREKQEAVVQIFFVRGGKMIGRDHCYLAIDEGEADGQILGEFVKQFYAGTPVIPRELFLQYPLKEEELIGEWLGKKRGQKVTFRTPVKGEKARLVELAARNARLVLDQDKEKLRREEKRTTGAARQLSVLLGLPECVRMEAYDISNISGVQSVGSMVVYENGRPKRSDYRKFRIRYVEGPNDYASMEEVLTRRFTHGLEEKAAGEERVSGSFDRFPDLILMDGGKGQVNIAEGVLKNLGLSIPVCGMVKDDNHRTRGLYFQGKEVPLDRHAESFQLITRIQDEAHRFAIEYHRSIRSKEQIHSVLDDIEGIGPARRKALMRYFKTIEAIRDATPEELGGVPQMNARAARAVYDFFRERERRRLEAASPDRGSE